MDIEVKDDIQEIKEDVKDIKKVLMGDGESNPHGGLVGKVVKIDTRQKVLIGILSTIGIASIGLIFFLIERLLVSIGL